MQETKNCSIILFFFQYSSSPILPYFISRHSQRTLTTRKGRVFLMPHKKVDSAEIKDANL